MTGIPDPVDILDFFFQLFKKYLNNILVIKNGNKIKIFFFLFIALKSSKNPYPLSSNMKRVI